MAHSKLFVRVIILLGISVPLVITSCVDETFDFAKGISTDMSIGGDSLGLPLGSTDTIRIGDFLDPEDNELIKEMANGGYGISMKDSLSQDFSELIPKNFNISDQTFSINETISFGNISVDDFKIPAMSVDTAISLSSNAISMDNFSVPSVTKSESFSAGMSDYKFTKPTLNDILVSGGKEDVMSDVKLPPDPGISGIELPLSDTTLPTFNSVNNINYNISVPDGVTGINRIELEDNTPLPVLVITIELPGAGSTFSKGSIIPDISITPADLFIFKTAPVGGVIKFDSNTPLNKANSFKQSKSYTIDAFNIKSDPIGGILNIASSMSSTGKVSLSGITVMSENIKTVAGIDVVVKAEVKNIRISSMDFNIPKINSAISGTVPINVNSTIPGEVKSVGKIYFNSPATLSFSLKALNLPTMISKTVKLDNLSIKFPDEIVFEPALTNNTYTVSNETLTNPETGKTISLSIKEMNFSGTTLDAQNKLVWNSNVTYNGTASFTGRLNSENIPSAQNDPKMSVDVNSALTFKSADVTTKDISKSFSSFQQSFNIDVNISDQVKRLDVINIEPGKKLRFRLIKPGLPLDIIADNIMIKFPPVFNFKQTLPNNTYVLNGTIPDVIELELASLNINRDLVNGRLLLKEIFSVSGGFKLKSGSVNSSEFTTLDNKLLGVEASMPELKIASTSIQLKTINASYADTTKFDFSIKDIPNELSAIDSVLFEDQANLQISINLSDVPTLNKPMLGDLILQFPDILMFKPGVVDSKNRLIVKKAFSNNAMTINAGLKGIKLAGKPISGSLNLNEDVGFDMKVTVEDPSINSDDVVDKPVGIAAVVKLNNLKLDRFYGTVNPVIDPITESISLKDLPGFMKNDDIVLDITKPVISIEGMSNFGIPVIANIKLVPIKNGSILTQGQQEINIRLPKANSVTEFKKSGFWIAPENSGMPEGYTFVPADIQKLFRTIPDNIELRIKVNTDASEQHFVDLNAEYKMKVNYEVSVPMAFGKELNIAFKDTIKDIDESIGKLVSGNEMEVLGSFYNSIPLELNVTLTPLDKDFQKINITPVNQIISAGAKDGSAVKSNLSLKLNDPSGLLKNLKAFQLDFAAKSNETVAGAPIKPDNFVKADLRLRLKGGVNIKK